VELFLNSQEPANVLAKGKHTPPDNKKANRKDYLSVFWMYLHAHRNSARNLPIRINKMILAQRL
jgi:hypothetical protein